MKPVKLAVFGMLTLIFLFSPRAYAIDANIKQKVINKSVNDAVTKAQSKIDQDAAQGVKLTYQALDQLKNKQTEQAKATLIEASKKIDAVTRKGNELLAVDVATDIESGVDTPEKALVLMEQAKKAINADEPRLARDLLFPLIDEIDVTVVSVPLFAYKGSLNKAMAALDKGETAKAERSLSDAAGSLISETAIFPIPLLIAQELLDEAAQVEQKNPEEALRIIKDVNSQIELASLLGYSSINPGKKQINEIKKKALSQKFEQEKQNVKNKLISLENKFKDETSEAARDLKGEISKIKSKL